MRRAFRGTLWLAGALAALVFLVPPRAAAQPDMSDFNPAVELRKIGAMPNGYLKVQRYYYLGELTSSSERNGVARDAYRGAILAYDKLSGNHRALAVPYAAQAALGLAGLIHLEFRAAPLRWESYTADSARRWGLLADAREQYNRVVAIGYVRATFEALYLRAHLLQEWDTGGLDTLAERAAGVPPLAQAIRHLSTALQMQEQAGSEYRRIIGLADSLGLTNGTGDNDVSEWLSAARTQLRTLPASRRNLAAREEALQALYAERQSAEWAARATPLLWEHAGELMRRDAGVADPFFDYYIEAKLVNDAYRPFIFGEDGFYTAQKKALDSARSVRSEKWVNERLAWQRRQEWLDTDISRRLARDGLAQLLRVPSALDTVVGQLAAAADSLPNDVRATLSRLPPAPAVRMPEVPSWGGLDPRMMSGEEERGAIDKFNRYKKEITDVERRINAYQSLVAQFSARVAKLSTGELPPELTRYNARAQGLRAAEIILLDTLGTMALDQVNRALETSREAAVWVPPGPQSVAAQQAMSDFVGAVAGDLRSIAERSRAAAERYRKKADSLNRRPPAFEMRNLADRLLGFAGRMETAADGISRLATSS